MAWLRRRPQGSEQAALTAAAVEAEVQGYFQQRIALLDGAALDPDTPIFSAGLLSSLDFIELVSFLQSSFAVDLSRTLDVRPANLDTVRAIVEAVLRAGLR